MDIFRPYLAMNIFLLPRRFSWNLGSHSKAGWKREAGEERCWTVATATVVSIYNLNGATELVLSTLALAQIFSGQITTWDDARTQAPDGTMPFAFHLSSQKSQMTPVLKQTGI